VSPKRTGRYGERPPGEGKTPTPAPPFSDRRGAPLPLLTQPMVAVEINRRELSDPAQTRLDNAVQSRATDPSQTRLDNPPQPRLIDTGPTRIDGMQPLKVEANAIAHGKPTVMMAPQSKPVGGPPQIDLTQHHLPDEPPDPRLALVIDPDSERSAAFRVLRHHLLEVGRPQVVIVSSPQAGDGKTTTAINLALALAECGRAKTLLVETHVRRPQFTSIFKFVPPWCFAEQLAAHRHQPTMPWSLVDIPQLWLHIAAINPRIAQTQLLDGPAFAIAMERLRQGGYDHIVVDAPPVLGSADVNLMADAADAVVFALRARRSTIRDLRFAIDQLGGTSISGTVLLQDD
jgi:Mrp family chromosome partitioning ATPase